MKRWFVVHEDHTWRGLPVVVGRFWTRMGAEREALRRNRRGRGVYAHRVLHRDEEAWSMRR